MYDPSVQRYISNLLLLNSCPGVLSSAAQFTYNRDQDFNLSSYMEEEIPEETEMDLDPVHAQAAAPVADRGLKNIDKGW